MISEKWQKLSLAEQMGNIGAEVSRVIHWHKKKDKESKEKALWRALELIDLTISDKRWRGRLLEICRLREVICDFFLENNQYKISSKFLKDYFLFFALFRKGVSLDFR